MNDTSPEVIVRELARLYADRREGGSDATSVSDEMAILSRQFLQRGEKNLLSAASEALRLNRLLRGSPDRLESLDEEETRALYLAFPASSLEQMRTGPEAALKRHLGAWKAALFEVVVCRRLHDNEVVGPVRLAPGQRAVLNASDPGDWNVRILNADGAVASDRQTLAEQILAPVKRAIGRFPDLKVLTTIDATEQIGSIIDRASGEKELTEKLLGALDEIMENPIHKLASWAAPALPFLVITVDEGHRYLAGRTGVVDALGSAARRAAGPGIPLAVGGALLLLGAGLLALPAAWATALGVGRIERTVLLSDRVRTAHQRIETLPRVLETVDPAAN